jgi:hypothetical protein
MSMSMPGGCADTRPAQGTRARAKGLDKPHKRLQEKRENQENKKKPKM